MAVEHSAVLLALLQALSLALSVAGNITDLHFRPTQQPAEPDRVPVIATTVQQDYLQPLIAGAGAPTASKKQQQPKFVHIHSRNGAAQPLVAREQASGPKAAAKQQDNTGTKGAAYWYGDQPEEEKLYDVQESTQSDEAELTLEYCPPWRPGTNNQGVTAAERPEPLLNVFSELTLEEYTAVLAYLFSLKHLELDDLSRPDDTAASTVLNYVHTIHMEAAFKSDVMNHLDSNAQIPPRKARVTVVMGKAQPPSVHEVLVTLKYVNGHPVASNLQHTDILSSKQSSLPYTQRPQGILDENGAHVAVESVREELNQFLAAAFKGGWSYGEECGDKCIDWTLTYAQFFSESMPRGAYLQFYWNDAPVNDGNYIHPIPLQMLVAAKGKSLAQWYVSKVWFNGVWFESLSDLVYAWKHDKDKLRSSWGFVIPEGESGVYSTFTARKLKQRGVEQPVGPVVWEPYGRRFTITGGNKVAWLGWSLYVGYLPHFGPRFWDLSFKGERIAYELSMQEAMTMYGGDDLTQTNGIFLDSAFGLGYNMRPLNQGIDCPMNAAFMDATIFYGGMPHPKTFKNAICVFERHTDVPLLRHYSSTFKFYGAVPGGELVVRMISSVYNYDYIQDLVLGVDGSVNVKVYTTGYAQVGPARLSYPQHYGYPLFHDVSGTVHTQVLAWKVDLDIAGTQNSVKLHSLKLTQADNGAGHKVWVNKYDSKIAKTEEDAAHSKGGGHQPTVAVVINEDETNAWGSHRGYKVQLHSTIGNMQPDDSSRKKGLGFWKWNFAATRHKDTETHSSSAFSQSDLARPPNSLCDYVDGDSIRRKDVVVWVNSGRYHIPSAEDAPVTPTSNPVLGFSLLPFNWGDENAATDMANMIQIDKDSVDTSNAVTNSLYKCAPTYTTVPFKEGAGTSYPEDDKSSGDRYNSPGYAGYDSPAPGYDSSAQEADDDYGEDGAAGSNDNHSSGGHGSNRGRGSSSGSNGGNSNTGGSRGEGSSSGSKGGGGSSGGTTWDNEHDLQGNRGRGSFEDEEGWETNVPPKRSSGGGTKKRPGYKVHAGYEGPITGNDAAKVASKVKAKARFQAKKRQMVPMVAGDHQQHDSSRAGTPRASAQLTAAQATAPVTAAATAAATTGAAAAAAAAQNPGSPGDAAGVLNPANGGTQGAPVPQEQQKLVGGQGSKEERRAARIQAMRCRRKSRFRSEAAC